MAPLDLSSIYAITLFRTTTILTVLYCSMHTLDMYVHD